MRCRTAAALLLLWASAALPMHAQADTTAVRALRDRIHGYRAAHDIEILHEFTEFLAIPNLASDSANIRRNAARLLDMMKQRGIAGRLLESPGSPPAVLGELRTPGAKHTVVFYAHYDGQPVDTTQWATPPWQPTLRDGLLEEQAKILPLPTMKGAMLNDEWRLYARSASDDKAPIEAMLAGLDALRAAGGRPTVNLKFFFEGGEEAGSPHMKELLTSHASELTADAWIFCDGPVHQSRRMQVVFGVRGSYGVDLTIYGPTRALHSGHYGNWAPNPASMMATLLAGMRDDDGKILIPGWYDDVRPVTAAEHRAVAEMPKPDSQMRQELALGRTEGDGALLADQIMLPALNIRGIDVGHVGAQASNTISTSARASIDFRLVPDQTPDHVRSLVESYLRSRGWFVVTDEPTPDVRRAHPRVIRLRWDDGGYGAFRTDLALPFSRAVVSAVADGLGAPPIRVPTLGGSLPMREFADVLQVPLVIVPIVNHDNNQHAANENLRLRNLRDGVEMMAMLMARLGTTWR